MRDASLSRSGCFAGIIENAACSARPSTGQISLALPEKERQSGMVRSHVSVKKGISNAIRETT